MKRSYLHISAVLCAVLASGAVRSHRGSGADRRAAPAGAAGGDLRRYVAAFADNATFTPPGPTGSTEGSDRAYLAHLSRCIRSGRAVGSAVDARFNDESVMQNAYSVLYLTTSRDR